MAQEKKSKKLKKSKDHIPKGLKAKKSFTTNKIFRVVVFSVIGMIGVIFVTQTIGTMQDSKSISEIGLIFGAITGI